MEFSQVTLEVFSKLEQKWLSRCESRKIRILSIDGGDTSGFVAGTLLIQLEKQIQAKSGDPNARIVDFFDLVAGAGIGAIYAAMITADDGEGRPVFTAAVAVNFLKRNNGRMFKPLSRRFFGVGLGRMSSSGKSMSNLLKRVFTRDDGKVLTIKDACRPLLIPCFDLNSSAPFVFSRTDASDSPSFDFQLWKVCRAAASTPNVFKPFLLNSVNKKTSCLAIEAGPVMNNPTAAAVTHILHNKRDFPTVSGIDDLSILSFGNGVLQSCRRLRRNGECSSSAVVEIAREAVSESVDQMLGNAFFWNRADYVRIQSNDGSMKGEEVLDEPCVESLPFGGKRLLAQTNGRRMENFLQRIVATGRTSFPPSPLKKPPLPPS